MLKTEDIEKFYKDVERLGLKFPGAEIARATAHSKANVSKYLSRKLEPSEAFLNAFNEAFQISGKKVSRETNESTYNRSEEMLFNLTESIRLHADAALLREQNYKETMARITENVPAKTQIAFESIPLGLQELLIDLGLGKNWKSRDEGAAIVRSKLSVHSKKRQADGIRNDLGK